MPEGSPFRNLDEGHHKKATVTLPDFNLQNVIIVVLLIVVVGFVVYTIKPELFKPVTKNLSSGQAKDTKTKNSGYSAVFLVNSQVYFGKLENAEGPNPKLKDVYYLRVQNQAAGATATDSASPNISLIKLGSELHGPADEITFNKEQIVLIQELTSDSRVFKAIEEYKARNK